MQNPEEDNCDQRLGEILRQRIFSAQRSFIHINKCIDDDVRFSQLIDQNSQREQIQSIPDNKLIQKCLLQIPSNENGNAFVTQNQLKELNSVWKKKGFTILKYIRKFILQVKLRTNQLRFKEMIKNQFQIVGDASCYWKYYKQKGVLINYKQNQLTQKALNCGKIIVQRLYQLSLVKRIALALPWNRQQLISPDSTFKVVWDIYILGLTIVNVLFVPYKISFQGQIDSKIINFSDEPHTIFQFTSCLLFICEIILRFNTAMYHKGDIINNRKKIASHLIKKCIFREITLIVLYLISVVMNFQYISLIILFQYKKIVNTMNNLIEKCNFKSKQLALFDLLKLIMLILFISHTCACGFILMHKLQVESDSTQSTWATSILDVDQRSMSDLYISALYWAIITMITVGYGDIHPVNKNEKIVIIIMTLLSCGVFAYALNQIGQIIDQITKKDAIFKSKLALLSNLMKKKGLNFNLQMKVRKYFEYLNEENIEEKQICEDMITQLPASLKREVTHDINKKILLNLKLFKFNFSADFINELSLKLHEKHCFAEEVIFDENEYNDNIYFLLKGDILINIVGQQKQQQMNSKKIIITQRIKKGEAFNEVSFFSDQPTRYQAVSKNLALLSYIKREDFLSTLKSYNVDFQKYFLIKDRINQYKIYKGLETQCSSCKKYTHQLDNCPYINYQPSTEKIIARYHKDSQPQDRVDDFLRKDRKQVNAILDQDEIQQQILQYICNNGNDQQIEETVERLKRCYEEIQGAYQRRYTTQSTIVEMAPTVNKEKRQSFSSNINEPTFTSAVQISQNTSNTHSRGILKSSSQLQSIDDKIEDDISKEGIQQQYDDDEEDQKDAIEFKPQMSSQLSPKSSATKSKKLPLQEEIAKPNKHYGEQRSWHFESSKSLKLETEESNRTIHSVGHSQKPVNYKRSVNKRLTIAMNIKELEQRKIMNKKKQDSKLKFDSGSLTQQSRSDNDQIEEVYVDNLDSLFNWDIYFPHNNFTQLTFIQKQQQQQQEVRKKAESKFEEIMSNLPKPSISPSKRKRNALTNQSFLVNNFQKQQAALQIFNLTANNINN